MIAQANTVLVSTLAFGVDDPGGQGEDFGKSSPVGLVLLILFFIAVGFLVRSMNRHLRRLPVSFDPPADDAEASRSDDRPSEGGGDGAGGRAGDTRDDASDDASPTAKAGAGASARRAETKDDAAG